MFKNLITYRIGEGWATDAAQLAEQLAKEPFLACAPTQPLAVGWAPPRGIEHAPLVEVVDGHWLIKLKREQRLLPSSVVQERVDELAEHIEATTGRKPGKKETKALREDALLSLLPQAFSRQQTSWVWIDPERGWLATDASSQGKLDDLVTALVRAFDGLVLTLFNTQQTPQSAMTQWLSASDAEEWPEGLAVERDCELRSSDEEKSVVKFTRHHLFNDEVRRHISEGKLPTRLALNWEGRVGFTLTESMALKKIQFLEGVFEENQGKEEQSFDSNVAIGTGELRGVLDALIAALGGELQPGQVPGHEPAPAGAAPASDATLAKASDDAPF